MVYFRYCKNLVRNLNKEVKLFQELSLFSFKSKCFIERLKVFRKESTPKYKKAV